MSHRTKPTVSPSTIPLVYYHINSFQQASSVEMPLPGGENRTAGRASRHEELCSDWVVSPHVWTTGSSLIAVWGLSGATPRGQPRTSAVTLPHGRTGLSARRMAVLWTFRAPSLGRHVHREFMRSALLDVTPIIPATACHQRNYVERYSRSIEQIQKFLGHSKLETTQLYAESSMEMMRESYQRALSR